MEHWSGDCPKGKYKGKEVKPKGKGKGQNVYEEYDWSGQNSWDWYDGGDYVNQYYEPNEWYGKGNDWAPQAQQALPAPIPTVSSTSVGTIPTPNVGNAQVATSQSVSQPVSQTQAALPMKMTPDAHRDWLLHVARGQQSKFAAM